MLRTSLVALLGVIAWIGSASAQCTVPNTLTNGTNADATQVMANFNALLTCINTPPAAGGLPTPQGRLTLVSGAPVMTSAQTGKTTIYYTPYVGNQILITTNGTSFTAMAFSELSNVTSNSSTGSAGPAAVVANSNYDLFVWSNGGVLTLTRGPAWTNDTTRSLAVQRISGIWTNQAAITNGPGAGLGTFVGTVRSDGTSQINWHVGGLSVAGTAALLGVWNTYNRIEVSGLVGDTTSSWSYSTGTWRAANGSNTMRVSAVVGLQEDFFQANYVGATANTGGVSSSLAGVGFDSTSAPSGRFPLSGAFNYAGTPLSFNPQGSFAMQPLGFHFMQALEWGGATWYGNGSTSQSGLTYRGKF